MRADLPEPQRVIISAAEGGAVVHSRCCHRLLDLVSENPIRLQLVFISPELFFQLRNRDESLQYDVGESTEKFLTTMGSFRLIPSTTRFWIISSITLAFLV